jgi:nickel-dependent lactate racemase
MAFLKIPYETAEEMGVSLELEVPDKNLLIKCIPEEPGPIREVANAVEEATESPVYGPRFSELIRGGKRVTFIVENQFRAAPARDILPGLVEKARQTGCDISIIIGNATLPPLSSEETEMKLGRELAHSGIPIVCNDVSKPEQYRYVGITRSGTPLFLHQVVADAHVIVTISTTQATIWGYGGSGMIIPAVVANETTEINHLMSMAPDCIPGNNDCLMQLDKYEALEMAKVNMGINVIVSNQNHMVFVNAGSPLESHKAAVEHYNGIYQFSVPGLNRNKADIALTGSTAPTNHLFLHSSWAAANCDPVVRDGGIIILATPCPGYGDWPGFDRMDLLKPHLPASREKQVGAIKDFYEQVVGKKKNRSFTWYKIYEVMARKEVWVVTGKANIPFCSEIGLPAYESIEEAFGEAMKKCGEDSQVAFIPYGRYTVVKPS